MSATMSTPTTTPDTPERAPLTGCAFGLAVVAALALVVTLAVCALAYNASDDRWHPQAQAFMTVFDAAAAASRGEGQWDQASQLNGFIETEYPYLTGEFVIRNGDVAGIHNPVDLDRAINIVAFASAAAGYDYECREIPDEKIEEIDQRLGTRLAGAEHRQQCLLSDGGDGRGSVRVVVWPDGGMSYSIDAGHVDRDWY